MVRWTPQTDQILLVKIIETSHVIADVDAIAKAWPKDLERPTPRAVSERIVKIRQNAKNTGAAKSLSVPNTPNKASPNGGIRRRRAATATPSRSTRPLYMDDDEYDSNAPEDDSPVPLRKRKRTQSMSTVPEAKASKDQQTVSDKKPETKSNGPPKIIKCEVIDDEEEDDDVAIVGDAHGNSATLDNGDRSDEVPDWV